MKDTEHINTIEKIKYEDINYFVVNIVNEKSNRIVTLAYHRGQYNAPIILAKGKDAKAFIEAATLIPLHYSPSLASTIYHNLNVGDQIYKGLYSIVAEVFADTHSSKEASSSLSEDIV